MISTFNAYGFALENVGSLTIDNTAQLKQFGIALGQLTPHKAAMIAITNNLNRELLEEALLQGNVDGKVKESILAHYSNAAAKTSDKVATDALTFSTSKLLAVIKAHPVIALLSVLTALFPFITKIADKMYTSAEEQMQIFDDLQSKYSSTVSELKSLGDELTNAKERLEELNKIGKLGALTVSQQEERKELEKTISDLERELTLLEKIEKVERKRTNDAAYDTLKKRSHRVSVEQIENDGYGERSYWVTETVDDVDAINLYLSQLEIATDRKRRIQEEWANDTSVTDDEYESYTEDIADLEEEIQDYESAIGDIVTAVRPLLEGITDTSGAAYDQKVALEAAIDKWLEYSGVANDAVVAADEFERTTFRLLPDLTSHVNSLTTVEDNISKLRDALADFRDDGYVSMDAFSDMAETFGEFPDEFERFISVASNSKSTMIDVRAAASDLAEAYLNSTDFLGNMTDGTIESTIATLKLIGVVNAEEVVMTRVAASKAETKLESAKLSDATWDEAKKHLSNVGATEAEINALLRLRQEKLNAKVATTNFLAASAETVSALMREAGAAGMATENLAALLELKNASESGELDGLTFSERTERLNTIVAKVRKDLDAIQTDFDGFNLSLSPTGDGAKTAAEEAREAFQLEYNAWKHKLDMEQITLEEFYAWLGGEKGYQDYFEDQGETLEDFRKYSKEVFDGLRDVHQQYLDVFDHEISVIERTEDSENELIAKYAQKRAEVHELIKELRKHLELQNMTEAEIISNEQYRAYMDMLYSIEDEVASIQEEAYEKQAGYVNDLIDLTEELIRQETEDHIDALEEEKDMYSELIQQRKDLIKLSRDQDTYERDRQNKLKEIQKIQERIAALDLDDSRAAALEKQGLLEELNKLQIELDDMQTEHYIESAEKALDDKEKAVHEEYDREIKALEDFLDDNAAINQAAMTELDQMNKDLFARLESYAAHYTDTTRDELLKMWEEVTAAAEKYGSVTNASKVYEDSDVDNKVKDIIRKMRENGQEYARSTDPVRKQALADKSLEHGADLQELLGVTVERVDGTWYIGDGPNRKKLFDVYHSGTPSVGGRATIKQNETFALLEKGESVLTKKQTNVLWEALKSFDLMKKVSSIYKFIPGSVKSEEKKEINIEVVMQPTIYGDATDVTMGVIRKEARNVADIVASKLR